MTRGQSCRRRSCGWLDQAFRREPVRPFAGCLSARWPGPGRDRDSRILTWYAMRRSGSDGAEERDQELGVFTPRTQVPRGQEQLGRQPDFAGVGQE
jgi:hypothetical protein